MAKRKLLVRAAGQTTQLPSSDTVAAFALGGNLVFGPKLDITGQATTNLMSVDSNNVEIQGTNGPITSFGQGVAGALKFVTFGTSGIVIKHRDGTIDLPGQQDITARQYDWLLAHCIATDNWRIRVYSRHDGTAVAGGSGDFKKDGSVTMTGAFNGAPSADISSASTTSIGAVNSNYITVVGTANINSFGPGTSGIERTLLFQGGSTIRGSAGAITTPANLDILTSLGDVAEVICDSSGSWRVKSYTKANGTALVGSGGGSGPASTDQLPEGSTNLYFTNTRARAATRFVWDQTSAAAVWTVPHNTNGYPSVTVVDSLGNVVAPDISYVDANTVQITHGAAYSGKAYIN